MSLDKPSGGWVGYSTGAARVTEARAGDRCWAVRRMHARPQAVALVAAGVSGCFQIVR